MSYDISPSLTSLSMTLSRSIHFATNSIISFFFYGWVIFHCMYVSHFLCPFLYWWAFSLLPCLENCKMLQWNLLGCMYPFESCFPLDLCPRVGLHGHILVYFQFFKESPCYSPQWLCQFTFPPTVWEGSLLHILLSIYCLYIFWW